MTEEESWEMFQRLFFMLVQFGFSPEYLFDQDILTFNVMVQRMAEARRLLLAEELPILATANSGNGDAIITLLKELEGGLLGATEEGSDIYKLANRLGSKF